MNQEKIVENTPQIIDSKPISQPVWYKNKYFWLGSGLGAVLAGTITGVTVNNMVTKREKRKAKERSDAYIAEAQEKMQKYVDENSIEVTVDAQATPEELNKAVSEALKAHLQPSEEVSGDTKTVNEENSAKKSDEKVLTEEDYAEKAPTNDGQSVEKYPWTISGREYHVQLKDGGVLTYPIELFCDKNGLMDVGRIRSNLRIYEHNPINLKRVWEALGWGTFTPDPEDISVIEDIENMNVSLEDLEEMDKTMGDEPEETTIERQRYLDKVEKYINSPSTGNAKIVSKRRYDEDCILEHNLVDYYDVDNVFTDNQDMNSTIDPTLLFGVSDGKELFEYKQKHLSEFEDDDQDPDIVYVENFADGSISEITRYHKSYQSMRDGSGYFDGDSGKVGGT